ncbi:ABC transporter ATP-binding protein [Corynebacterium pygosceleis]|uniref:ABC transporter ATP-binding protein n=1 Tax=Corynebacterium pygosceleis TaxID=2800406 RepID=A0A9Q4C7A4_9CORY|nr:ABC transporter ATP-binding protein [Corynebacterium pygosceleis]MCK7637034.1 ABC transporter ATP-binding protein/permease [Corynebacterium pygosceleis]MCK7674508.1 ABC transporter ATP-binding protein/permease [Corynebacterium pygosceleis]MCL0120194.1 ABC transporter ATP-binding protein/permease [Corynebacterium pygosceleis]MCX7467787.1 ABC transporter ATP-binding protein [Corynebacterium pygosceleis]
MTPGSSATGHHDALVPAPLREIGRCIRALPGFPGPGWWLLTVAVFGVNLASMTGSSTLLGRSVDLISGLSVPGFGSGRDGFTFLLVVVGALMFLELVTRPAATYLMLTATRRLSVDLRRRCLGATLEAPIPDVLQLGTGNVITRLTKDIDTAYRTVQGIGPRVVVTALMFPFTFVALTLVSPWYLLLLLLLPAIFAIPVKRTLTALPAATNALSTAQARRNNMLLDTIRGMPTIRSFGVRRWAVERLERNSWFTVRREADRIPLFLRLIGTGYLAYGVLLSGAIAMSTWLVADGVLTTGQAAAAIVLVVRLEIHVFNVLIFTGEIQNALTALGRAVSLAMLSDNAIDAPAPADCTESPEVRIENLGFRYPGGAAIIDDLSLTLEPGTMTALVGASGAGKSTLAGLIAGLQRPSSGTISIGGTDTSTVPDTWTARQVSLISQEVHLFSGTLRDDLRMASPEADDATLIGALTRVGLGPDSPGWQRWLPGGLDTLIGAGHDDLAPEVEQQISLARMILIDPPVLIMDEATSEAGSDNARSLELAAQEVARGRTSLVVAHRLDQAVTADRIILMDHGAVFEDGSHRELLSARGRYADLYARWSGSRDDG